MKAKTNKTSGKKKTVSSGEKSGKHEFETMSQVQNRYGKGREKNGSDGSSTEGRGSNH